MNEVKWIPAFAGMTERKYLHTTKPMNFLVRMGGNGGSEALHMDGFRRARLEWLNRARCVRRMERRKRRAILSSIYQPNVNHFEEVLNEITRLAGGTPPPIL